MARDPYAALFLYRRGQVVRWAECPGLVWRIAWRRWTQRDILGPIVEYLLEPVQPARGPSGGDGCWAYEADLEAGEAEAP